MTEYNARMFGGDPDVRALHGLISRAWATEEYRKFKP